MSVVTWVGLLAATLLLIWPVRPIAQLIATRIWASQYQHALPDMPPTLFDRDDATVGQQNCLSFGFGDPRYGWLSPGYRSVKTGRRPSALRGGSGWLDWLALLRVDGLRPLRNPQQLCQGFPLAVYVGLGPDIHPVTGRRTKDYHFARPDRVGGWWHKQGEQPVAPLGWPPLLLGHYVLVGVYVVDQRPVPPGATTALPWYLRRRAARLVGTGV